MTKSVIVLGAKGRFGRTVAQAFSTKGWDVTALARNWDSSELSGVKNYKTISAFDKDALSKACMGHDVIVNALNPSYEKWEKELPLITQNVIEAGLASKATVIIPGNIYVYGNRLPAVIHEKTAHVPNFKKSRLRVEMEQAYRDATEEGLRTIILRSGDYFEEANTGDWFNSQIANKLHKGLVTYPGPLSVVHSWAYLPDKARAMVALAEISDTFKNFEEFLFRGYAVTGQELVDAFSRATNRPLRTRSFPWRLIQVLGLFSKFIGEVVEMKYLWELPHEIEDTKLRTVLPDFEPTPFNTAIQNAVGSKLKPTDSKTGIITATASHSRM